MDFPIIEQMDHEGCYLRLLRSVANLRIWQTANQRPRQGW